MRMRNAKAAFQLPTHLANAQLPAALSVTSRVFALLPRKHVVKREHECWVVLQAGAGGA